LTSSQSTHTLIDTRYTAAVLVVAPAVAVMATKRCKPSVARTGQPSMQVARYCAVQRYATHMYDTREQCSKSSMKILRFNSCSVVSYAESPHVCFKTGIIVSHHCRLHQPARTDNMFGSTFRATNLYTSYSLVLKSLQCAQNQQSVALHVSADCQS
jgi:hypothetical protein